MTDLTEQAKNNLLDPVFERDEELFRVLQANKSCARYKRSQAVFAKYTFPPYIAESFSNFLLRKKWSLAAFFIKKTENKVAPIIEKI